MPRILLMLVRCTPLKIVKTSSELIISLMMHLNSTLMIDLDFFEEWLWLQDKFDAAGAWAKARDRVQQGRLAINFSLDLLLLASYLDQKLLNSFKKMEQKLLLNSNFWD